MRRVSLAVLCLAALPATTWAAAPTDGGAAARPLPPAREAPAAMDRESFRKATAALAVAGYEPGPVDGDWDPADREALAAYQADWQLPTTGKLDGDLLLRLLREHPETEPQWVETAEGCRVWNRYPQARETASWTGPCTEGFSSGSGTLTWTYMLRGETLTESYDGERREGRENGRGVYTGAQGDRYEGGWRDGLKDGEGVYTSPEGHVYEGGYREGLRHGRGTYTRTEGSSYEGEWRDGVQHGRGVATWPDGTRYEGLLVEGRPEGEGTLSFPDGNVYSGEWHAGCFADGLRGATAGVTLAECGWK